jgi:hypothetical protein
MIPPKVIRLEGLSAHQKLEVDEEHDELMKEIEKQAFSFQQQEREEPQLLEIDISSKKMKPTGGDTKLDKKKNVDLDEIKEKKKGKKGKDGGSSARDDSDSHTLSKDSLLRHFKPVDRHQDEVESYDNDDSVLETAQIQKKKKEKEKENQKEFRTLLQTIEEIEENLQKTREQYKIVIYNITVSRLPRIHKLVRNHPWLKVNYGEKAEWVAEYERISTTTFDEEKGGETVEDVGNNREVGVSAVEDGSKAGWIGLNWNFKLERNANDRSDLTVTVCSKDLIIGRYVINKEEFKEIPQSNSGFFAISGNITNALGKVGKIQFICQKVVVEKPAAPVQRVASPSSSPFLRPTVKSEKLNPDRSGKDSEEEEPAEGQDQAVEEGIGLIEKSLTLQQWKYDYVSIRILSLAVMDCKSVHFFESNSPFVVVECGQWIHMTEPIKNSGMAAAWKKLHWKLLMEKISGVSVAVNSNNVNIGKVFLSADDLLSLSAYCESSKIISVIKYLFNGKEITGKLKMNLIINHPDDVVSSKNAVLLHFD